MPAGRAILIADLAFGDCGKGTIVDFLASRTSAHTVVRFNGGPQAGHNVVTPDGRHHTFAQFGSGTFVPGTRTLLSRFMMIEPYALFNEAAHLDQLGVRDAMGRLFIDARCTVITPAHQAANRIREAARGAAAHGTCGMGIGEAAADALARPELTLRAEDLSDATVVRHSLRAICARKREELADAIRAAAGHPKIGRDIGVILEPTWIEAAVENYAALADRATIIRRATADAMLREPGTTLFEGAQGVLLDERYGFHPHTTWSTTMFANADTLLDEAGSESCRTRVGVLRTYATRHGAGPLVTEDRSLRESLPEPHNGDAGWQGSFRVGPFDAVAARYAIAAAGGVDCLALTHADRLPQLPRRICTEYDVALPNRGQDGPRSIRDLPFKSAPELTDQERLTQLLRDCRPVYCPLEGGEPESFLTRIERETGAPIGITSSGPTAADKRVIAARL